MSVKTSKIYFKLGYFRILHSLPDMPSVDIYLNDKFVAENLSYGNYTAYFPMFEESYKITLFETGTQESPILNSSLSIAENDVLTLTTVKTDSDLGFLSVPDKNVPIDPSKAMIRFAHLSSNTPAVDITLPDGTILFSNISFDQRTPYLAVDPSEYILQVRAAGTPTVLLTIPNINLDSDNYYTVYAIGLVDQKPELEALLLLDGFK